MTDNNIPQTVTSDHISVCICTYKRPQMLAHALEGVALQTTEDRFSFEVIVIDNDNRRSGEDVIKEFQENNAIKIVYGCEPKQNIALTRNQAIRNACGNFIAFIDDDEFPCERWLLRLYNDIKRYNSDGILGPVVPYFEKEPPKWVLKGRIFERPTHPTGFVMGWRNTRTGNALIKKELFRNGDKWFDPAFGSGGEDRDFFKRMIKEGKVFVWSNEALVFETIPPTRWKRTVLTKRALLRGKTALNSKDSGFRNILKSACAIAVYGICMPLFFVVGHHVFMKYLIKCCDHLGKVLAFVGIDLVKEKYVGG
jgi:succinoglycan biosynthesis protein ExoM